MTEEFGYPHAQAMLNPYEDEVPIVCIMQAVSTYIEGGFCDEVEYQPGVTALLDALEELVGTDIGRVSIAAINELVEYGRSQLKE